MNKFILSSLLLFSLSSSANVIDDYNAPLLIDGQKLSPYLTSKGYSEAETNIILDLSSLYRDGDIESFCKGWGYGKNVSHYQFFLNSGAYLMLENTFGREKTSSLMAEASAISEKYRKSAEPYYIFMKKKTETGKQSEKEYFENFLCHESINSSRMDSAAGISVSLSDLKNIK